MPKTRTLQSRTPHSTAPRAAVGDRVIDLMMRWKWTSLAALLLALTLPLMAAAGDGHHNPVVTAVLMALLVAAISAIVVLEGILGMLRALLPGVF